MKEGSPALFYPFDCAFVKGQLLLQAEAIVSEFRENINDKSKKPMKTSLSMPSWLALAALATLNLQIATAFAQPTAFTYQGRLDAGGSPANGFYDLRFQNS